LIILILIDCDFKQHQCESHSRSLVTHIENKIIQNEVEILLKSGLKNYLIKNLTTSDKRQ